MASEKTDNRPSSPKGEGSPDDNSNNSGDTEPTYNRLRPVTDVINRLIWDPAFDSSNYIIIYEDRFEGRMEVNLDIWRQTRESTDEEFIPQHRILYIKRRSDNDIIWDRRRRIDKVFLSGNSAFDYLAFLN
ncbi:leukocyte receptor cluster (LRC) member 9 [Aspergillus nanangensis]|uniref:Leukocyte receptor cluster (LRC) member 9 n=1 Tax=Aspergillus nanangensis TaxID=2582783 RepID=A0AAD4GQI8_ASPNN|nr:leukocyte receptor cluster (LRC) member 9 [Aspergillus nanangensis]